MRDIFKLSAAFALGFTLSSAIDALNTEIKKKTAGHQQQQSTTTTQDVYTYEQLKVLGITQEQVDALNQFHNNLERTLEESGMPGIPPDQIKTIEEVLKKGPKASQEWLKKHDEELARKEKQNIEQEKARIRASLNLISPPQRLEEILRREMEIDNMFLPPDKQWRNITHYMQSDQAKRRIQETFTLMGDVTKALKESISPKQQQQPLKPRE